MAERATIKLAMPDSTVEDCHLEFEITHDAVMMTSTSEGTGDHVWHGHDAFHALELFRREFEPKGFRALCNGSRRDAYPSGMCRDMGRGFTLYSFSGLGPPTLKTFEPAPIEKIATADEQLNNWKDWIERKTGRRPDVN